jgi:hypothetical protein
VLCAFSVSVVWLSIQEHYQFKLFGQRMTIAMMTMITVLPACAGKDIIITKQISNNKTHQKCETINKTDQSPSYKKQTPWPLVREQTIPTERPPLVGDI